MLIFVSCNPIMAGASGGQRGGNKKAWQPPG